MKDFDRVIDALAVATRVVVSTHQNPDGDAVGTELALALVMEKLGAKVDVVNADPCPDMFAFLPTSRRVRVCDPTGESPSNQSLGIAVECPDVDRLGRTGPMLSTCHTLINIDHHPGNTAYGHLNIVDPSLAAVAELAIKVIRALEAKTGKPLLDRNVALCLYVALMTDTGRFSYENTTADSHKVASELLAFGVNPYEAASEVYESSSLSRLRLLQLALQTLRVSDTGVVAWVTVTKGMMSATKTGAPDTDGFVNFPRSIKGVRVAITFREGEGRAVRVSLRSKGGVAVNRLAEHFGGGGHEKAAGCTVIGTIEEAVQQVVRAAEAEVLSRA